MVRVFESVAALQETEGQDLGVGEWLEIDQERINRFADATDDHQWIHVDAERAASGPYGKTISHGYLTLSLVPALVKDVYKVEGVRMAINYGLNKVRFLAPVPVGSRVRARVELLSTTASGQGVQANYRVTVELEGSERPALIAETIGLLIPDTTA